MQAIPHQWHHLAQSFFEGQIEHLGLSDALLENQSLEALQQSLQTINQAIIKADSFGILRLSVQPDGHLKLAPSAAEAQLEMGILPLLLERKRFVLQRIQVLSDEQKLTHLQTWIAKIEDDTIRTNLAAELGELQQTTQANQQTFAHLDQAQRLLDEQIQRTIAQLRTQSSEPRSPTWLTLLHVLNRELAATTFGGILLFVIAIVHIVAVFNQIPFPDALNATFFIILGYLFGQSVHHRASKR